MLRRTGFLAASAAMGCWFACWTPAAAGGTSPVQAVMEQTPLTLFEATGVSTAFLVMLPLDELTPLQVEILVESAPILLNSGAIIVPVLATLTGPDGPAHTIGAIVYPLDGPPILMSILHMETMQAASPAWCQTLDYPPPGPPLGPVGDIYKVLVEETWTNGCLGIVCDDPSTPQSPDGEWAPCDDPIMQQAATDLNTCIQDANGDFWLAFGEYSLALATCLTGAYFTPPPWNLAVAALCLTGWGIAVALAREALDAALDACWEKYRQKYEQQFMAVCGFPPAGHVYEPSGTQWHYEPDELLWPLSHGPSQ